MALPALTRNETPFLMTDEVVKRPSLPAQRFVAPKFDVGRAELQSITLDPVAPGNDLKDFVVPSQRLFDLYTVFKTLTTSVAVANRQPQLELRNQNNQVVWRGSSSPSGGAQVASLTKDHVWAKTFGYSQNIAGGTVENGLPDLPPLPPGWRIHFLTPALDAADVWSNGLISGRFYPLEEGKS